MSVFFLSIQKYILLPVAVACMAATASAQVFNVADFGAKGDGHTNNTLAIQRAIDSCALHGGQVFFPAGDFVSATLYLKSNVTLHLSGKAVLLADTNVQHYPYLDAGIHFYGEDWARQALLFCKNAENVTIEGSGMINGRGASFPLMSTQKPDRYKNRPYLLWFAGSKNITVRDVRLRNSPFWMQHYLCCDNVTIDGIDVWNHSNRNNDLMDIDGCKNVTVSNVTGDSDDDGITIKSTSPRISEHITITNCVISSHCNALKFGTESTGGFRDVTVSNCVIKPSGQLSTIYGYPAGISGLALEMVDGGIMENINISNIVIEGPQVPLFIRLGNRARKYVAAAEEPGYGVMRNIHISHVTATGAAVTGCSITGLPASRANDISLDHIYIETNGGGTVADANRPLENKEKAYPEATMFGTLPAYGFYASDINGLSLSDIRLRYKDSDKRPGIKIERVERLALQALDVQTVAGVPAAVELRNCKNGYVHDCVQYYPAGCLVRRDKASTEITVNNNHTPGMEPVKIIP